jgi:PAS domain S-box-containing protein
MTNHNKVITNIHTQETLIQAQPIFNEILYEDGAMITETDPQGIITYANRKFREISGFSKKELIGSPHSLLRHPEMPVGLFKAMWKIISAKKVWRGYIKSLCKDGSFYWALVYIQPKLDEDGNIIGYASSRRYAYPESIKEVTKHYANLRGDEYIDDEYFMNTELFHGDAVAKFS